MPRFWRSTRYAQSQDRSINTYRNLLLLVFLCLVGYGISNFAYSSVIFVVCVVSLAVVLVAQMLWEYQAWTKRTNHALLHHPSLELDHKLLHYDDGLPQQQQPQKEIRIFMDGAFDLLHFGHMNAFRLAKSLGTHLIVGVNSDHSIADCKGCAPLMNTQERTTMVQACKFVDQVIPDCPYIMNQEYLDWIFTTYNVDYVVHGDDACIVNGKDVYESAKRTGKFRTIPRTNGVSTTDIVGRMLLLTKEHHILDSSSIGRASSKFLTTSRMLRLFSADHQAPPPNCRVVYVDGSWDLFHPGHVQTLQACRSHGDYLIVGIHNDSVINQMRGMNLPLMNLHERVLSVLGCRYVNDVLIDAPFEINPAMVQNLNISKVLRVTHNHDQTSADVSRFQYPIAAGIFHTLHLESDFCITNVIQRIKANQETFQERFDRKSLLEQEHEGLRRR